MTVAEKPRTAATATSTMTSGSALSWRQYKAILRKDIVMELRTKEMITSMGLYALLTMLIYQVALSQAGTAFDPREIAAGLLWLAFVFTSMLGLNRSLVHEKDQGCLEALLLSPVDRPIIFFAKATGNFIFLFIVQMLTIPVFAFLFLQRSAYGGDLWMIPLALIGGAIGISAVGTLLATMSVNTKGKDFVLAVLFVPLMYPLLLACVAATSAAVLGGDGYTQLFWSRMAIIGAYDAIMVAAAFALYEFVIGA